MDTSKIDRWFKVAVDEEAGDDWMVALFGRDNDAHDYAVVTNGVKASVMADHDNVFLGAKADSELVAELLNKWHSSRRSHPAMAEEYKAALEAYRTHLEENHPADFEACDNLACHLAVLLEVAYGWINPDLMTHDEGRQ